MRNKPDAELARHKTRTHYPAVMISQAVRLTGKPYHILTYELVKG
jgi:hypothetical protein